ncbi:hypothetical protein GHT06_012274 [Daphnia sinensis]|uniref:Uncharacterized protein n=1 Tax=Daphnia sinensis TaxID=1820382 RepID=A0AAD5LNY3_9CRUS|nr:hypothetical protein GHT06_012274 [Daphnia sinensis]
MSRRILLSLCVLVAVLALVNVAEGARERRQLINAILGAALGSPGYGQHYGGYGQQGYYGGYGGRPSGYGGYNQGYSGYNQGYSGYNQGYGNYVGRPSGYGQYGNQGYYSGRPVYG